jgi:hypothetical protein
MNSRFGSIARWLHRSQHSAARPRAAGFEDLWFAAAIAVTATLGVAVLLEVVLRTTVFCLAGRTC